MITTMNTHRNDSLQIRHLIFTRFNIQYEEGDTIGICPSWLDERLRLFEAYCLPPIQHQTCTNFIWLIIGDSRTPIEYKTRIESYKTILPQIRVIWTPYQKDCYHNFYRNLGQEFASGYDILISTRLDSDDATPANYVEVVQKIAQEGLEGIISFPVGKQTFVNTNKSYKVRYVQNHSTSRIEKSGFETIMVYDHTQVTIDQEHLFETKEPMWEEIVHGGNMLNDYVPKYHYYINGFSDFWDLSRRWVRFQWKRLKRFLDTFFVSVHKS